MRSSWSPRGAATPARRRRSCSRWRAARSRSPPPWSPPLARAVRRTPRASTTSPTRSTSRRRTGSRCSTGGWPRTSSLHLADPALAADAYDRLLPYAGYSCCAGSGNHAGPVDLFLALAAAARGDRDLAARHAEDAERLCAEWQIPLAAQWLRDQRDRYAVLTARLAAARTALTGPGRTWHDACMPATPGTAEHPSLREAAAAPYWLDRPDRPEPRAPLDAHADSDLCIVGGGYSGLWTALLAKERDPVARRGAARGQPGRLGGVRAQRRVLRGVADPRPRATARSASPTRSTALDRLGRENLDAIEATLQRYGIDCDFERTGALTVATEPHQVRVAPRAATAEHRAADFLDRDAMRAEVDSPTYLAGVYEPRRHGARRPGPAGVGARARPPSRSACASPSARRRPAIVARRRRAST